MYTVHTVELPKIVTKAVLLIIVNHNKTRHKTKIYIYWMISLNNSKINKTEKLFSTFYLLKFNVFKLPSQVLNHLWRQTSSVALIK